jgi:two-component system alkaline phosphatase synthesis response regulator PhoP
MANGKILVVDDEKDIVELIAYNLVREHYEVVKAYDGISAISIAQRESPDLVILDLMLPGKDGLEVCRQLKKDPRTEAISIIMLSAKDDESDIVAGLELGAEDYITKPFSARILLARIKTVLRRKHTKNQHNSQTSQIGNISINAGKHEVIVEDRKIDLTATEFQLLHYLIDNAGWVCTRQQIINSLKGHNYATSDRAIDVQVVSLRKKLGSSCDAIETVRGIGYRFKEEQHA